MPKAIWNDAVVADSEKVERVEGNVYFPPDSLSQQHFRESDTTTICPWKGVAHYYDLVVDDRINPDAAWYYPDPKPAAANIRGMVGFWHGVEVR